MSEFATSAFAPAAGGRSSDNDRNVVLEQAGTTKLDFVTMDSELSELKALAGFDIERYTTEFVRVEAHSRVRQQILDHFMARRYVVVGKYLRADSKNLCFRRFLPRHPAD